MEKELTVKQMIQRGEEVYNDVLGKLSQQDAECLSEYIEDLCKFAVNDAIRTWIQNEEEKLKYGS